MTMTSENWIDYLPVAYYVLLEPELMCQKDFEEKLNEIATEFVWLTEIVDEANKLFADKSHALKHMPQTPSMKQRAQERNRHKVEAAIKKGTASSNNLISRSIVPKQLQFGREPLNSAANVLSKPGIQFQRTSRTEINRLSKKIIEKPKSSDITNSELKEPKKLPPRKEVCKENKQPVREISSKSTAREHRIVPSREVKAIAPKLSIANKKSDATNNQSEEKSKSVSDHATACSIVLKPGASKSSIKLESLNKMAHVAAKLDISRNKCSTGKLVCSKMSSGNTASNKVQGIKSSSFNSLQQSTKSTIEQKKDVNKSKTMQNSIIESSSNIFSKQGTGSHLSVFSGEIKDLHKDINVKDKCGLLDDIRNTQCQRDDLNETVTIVTEVFEIVGKDRSVRLKEFEVVKTKTAPVSEIIKPQDCFVLVDSTLNRQCSSIDQGFNDDYDESSDETLSHSKNSAGDEFGNELMIENEIDLTAHIQARGQETDVMTNNVKTSKANKDSGIHSGTVKPASFANSTAFKDETMSENNDRIVLMSTNMQKESSTKNVFTEDTARFTHKSQREIQVSRENQSRSEQTPQGTAKGMSPQLKRSCIDHEKSAEQKQQKLLDNENHDKEKLRKAAEMRKQKLEDLKILREEKEQKIVEAREMRLRYEQEQKEKLIQKFESKIVLKEKLAEERYKEDMEKQKQRLKKQADTDARRKEEEQDRVNKLRQQEEERKMQEELMRSKKEQEKADRRQRIEEERKREEERLAEFEQRRKEDKLRMKQLKQERDEKEREMELLKVEKEKRIALERAERERIEKEKKEERDRKILEEQEKLKSMEKERLQRQQERMQQQQELQQTKTQMMASKHSNSPFKKPPASNTIKTTTHTLDSASNNKITSYEITPVKRDIVSHTSGNPENYNIEDKGSDDSTDDEEAPKKKIPEWASGIPLNTALIRQHMNPPDLERIFRFSIIDPPDLVRLFPNRRKIRYKIRTSSANWNSPPLPQH